MLSKHYEDQLHEVIYQIYPRSFMDSNGDGIGDLGGILQKLDLLRDLGVTAVWLCPCFQSPCDDNGYDISDYRDTLNDFGTMEDMDRLIEGLHARGMKLFLDLVPNHTSTEHPWFQASRQGRDNPYSDYYYWFDEPPNDWQSVFLGSAWAFDEKRGQYYLHSFAKRQADLNWSNPKVLKEMQDIVDFWVDRGADGFRIDVIDMIAKDFQEGKNGFGPHLHEYIHALFGREKTKGLFTVGESGVTDIEEMIRHGAEERGELTTLFLFDHMECGREDKFTRKPDSMKSLRDRLLHWQRETDAHDLLHSLFLENHDQPPMISRIADDGEKRYESATDLAAMVYLMKGIPFIYQGQEIGMTSARYGTISDFDDIESMNAYREFCQSMSEREALEKINFGSRDNARRPMSWDDSGKGGFTTGTPWIPLHSRHGEISLEKDLKSERSVWRFYQALLRLRREHEALVTGRLDVLSSREDPFLVYTRTLGDERWVIVCNFEEKQQISLPFPCEAPALANLSRKTEDGTYLPYECAVARVR